MMISGIGERKRENNLLLLMQECCKRASGKIPLFGFRLRWMSLPSILIRA
jgi:hypothetical protein